MTTLLTNIIGKILTIIGGTQSRVRSGLSSTLKSRTKNNSCQEGVEWMTSRLGFEIYSRVIASEAKQSSNNAKEIAAVAALPRNDEVKLPKLITGHIDLLQIRNGQIHLLDYKPNAAKERPIEQLTIYAMALSRLTGLRLFEFKCAWFDEKDYFPISIL